MDPPATEDKFNDMLLEKYFDPIPPEQIAKLKDKYKERYEVHRIHTLNGQEEIVMADRKIDDFAVKLSMCRELPHKGTFIDEARQYVDNIKDIKGDDIDITNLIDGKSRVTFIRGIEGMGKSVLAKQITYKWAVGDLFQNFRLCVMLECKELNCVKDQNEASLSKHEILDEFLEEEVGHYLGDGEGVLVIVDGLDELYDVNETDSIIFDLLNTEGKYGMAKVIITGRPHIIHEIESKDAEMGGLRMVDVLGLSNEQIQEYIKKFASLIGCAQIESDKRSLPKRILPILRVPQFLNIYCCNLFQNNTVDIKYQSEFYCWMIIFLQRQIDQKKRPSAEKMPRRTVKRFSDILLELSELGYNSLKNNDINLSSGIESLIDENGLGQLVNSLVIGVPDCSTKRYQIKNLLLMEFLSAIHVYSSEKRMDIIKTFLDQGWIDVVSYVCELVTGFLHSGIIQRTLSENLAIKREDQKPFLDCVLKLIHQSELIEKTRFEKSIQIIALSLSEAFTDKKILLQFIKELACWRFYSNGRDSDNLMEICDHLEKQCHCNEVEIRQAFDKVSIEVFIADDIGHLSPARYFKITTMILEGVKLDSDNIGKLELTFAHCESVQIKNCEITDEKKSSERALPGGIPLKELIIRNCTLTYKSFKTLCDWGKSCKMFEMWHLENVECWSELAEALEDQKERRNLELKRLFINNCNSAMSDTLKQRIVHCGVKLSINGKKVIQIRKRTPATESNAIKECRTIEERLSNMLPQLATLVEDARKEILIPDNAGLLFDDFRQSIMSAATELSKNAKNLVIASQRKENEIIEWLNTTSTSMEKLLTSVKVGAKAVWFQSKDVQVELLNAGTEVTEAFYAMVSEIRNWLTKGAPYPVVKSLRTFFKAILGKASDLRKIVERIEPLQKSAKAEDLEEDGAPIYVELEMRMTSERMMPSKESIGIQECRLAKAILARMLLNLEDFKYYEKSSDTDYTQFIMDEAKSLSEGVKTLRRRVVAESDQDDVPKLIDSVISSAGQLLCSKDIHLQVDIALDGIAVAKALIKMMDAIKAKLEWAMMRKVQSGNQLDEEVYLVIDAIQKMVNATNKGAFLPVAKPSVEVITMQECRTPEILLKAMEDDIHQIYASVERRSLSSDDKNETLEHYRNSIQNAAMILMRILKDRYLSQKARSKRRPPNMNLHDVLYSLEELLTNVKFCVMAIGCHKSDKQKQLLYAALDVTSALFGMIHEAGRRGGNDKANVMFGKAHQLIDTVYDIYASIKSSTDEQQLNPDKGAVAARSQEKRSVTESIAILECNAAEEQFKSMADDARSKVALAQWEILIPAHEHEPFRHYIQRLREEATNLDADLQQVDNLMSNEKELSKLIRHMVQIMQELHTNAKFAALTLPGSARSSDKQVDLLNTERNVTDANIKLMQDIKHDLEKREKEQATSFGALFGTIKRGLVATKCKKAILQAGFTCGSIIECCDRFSTDGEE